METRNMIRIFLLALLLAGPSYGVMCPPCEIGWDFDAAIDKEVATFCEPDSNASSTDIEFEVETDPGGIEIVSGLPFCTVDVNIDTRHRSRARARWCTGSVCGDWGGYSGWVRKLDDFACPGDLDKDGLVNGRDFNLLLGLMRANECF